MNTSRIRVGLAVGFLGLALSTGTAAAQICTASDCDKTTSGGSELGTGVKSSPGGETGGLPGEAEPGVAGENETVGEAAQAAPEGTLPFTGGDVAGLVLIGGAAVGAGALLLRRSKTATA